MPPIPPKRAALFSGMRITFLSRVPNATRVSIGMLGWAAPRERKSDMESEGRERTLSERDYLAKEEALRRLSEPEGDHELHAALARMRESHPHLWEVIHRVHLSRDVDPSRLEEWRRAPEGSQEDIWASHYDEAMGVLAMALQ